MQNLIKINGKYGAKVGGRQVFTVQGALDMYRTFCKACLREITPESCYVLSQAACDMYALGFTPAEVEAIEIEVMQAAA